jgi:hypothetical protein
LTPLRCDPPTQLENFAVRLLKLSFLSLDLEQSRFGLRSPSRILRVGKRRRLDCCRFLYHCKHLHTVRLLNPYRLYGPLASTRHVIVEVSFLRCPIPGGAAAAPFKSKAFQCLDTGNELSVMSHLPFQVQAVFDAFGVRTTKPAGSFRCIYLGTLQCPWT